MEDRDVSPFLNFFSLNEYNNTTKHRLVYHLPTLSVKPLYVLTIMDEQRQGTGHECANQQLLARRSLHATTAHLKLKLNVFCSAVPL
jgi:hypothetical protein